MELNNFRLYIITTIFTHLQHVIDLCPLLIVKVMGYFSLYQEFQSIIFFNADLFFLLDNIYKY